MNNNTSVRTKKYASPDTLFSRFLQRRAKKPTEIQLHTWENDGGNVEVDNDLVIINGHVCTTLTDKIKAYVGKYLRLMRMRFHSIFPQQQQPQEQSS